jgi:hypothetical protein
VNSNPQQKQQHSKPLPTAAAAAANPSAAGGASSGGAAAAANAQPTEQEQEEALQWLRKLIAKAGGSLEEGWRVVLSARRANGKWGNRRFVAPDGTVCYSAPQVKRHLGMEQPAGELAGWLLQHCFTAVLKKRCGLLLQFFNAAACWEFEQPAGELAGWLL